MNIKSIIISLQLLILISTNLSAKNYVFYSYSNDRVFYEFNDKVNSFDNALMIIVQTYDKSSRLQTIEDIKVTVVNNTTNIAEETKAKTPYINVLADYKEFKKNYDFATSNAKRYMLSENPDTSYIVKIDADLPNSREIRAFVIDRKKIIASQSGSSFPFLFAAACKVEYSQAIKDEDKSINNSGLNDWKDYIGGPKIIKKGNR